MFGLSATEIAVILLVALVVFGPKQLPRIARRLGRALGEFRKAGDELKTSLAADLEEGVKEARSKPPSPGAGAPSADTSAPSSSVPTPSPLAAESVGSACATAAVAGGAEGPDSQTAADLGCGKRETTSSALSSTSAGASAESGVQDIESSDVGASSGEPA